MKREEEKVGVFYPGWSQVCSASQEPKTRGIIVRWLVFLVPATADLCSGGGEEKQKSCPFSVDARLEAKPENQTDRFEASRFSSGRRGGTCLSLLLRELLWAVVGV